MREALCVTTYAGSSNGACMIRQPRSTTDAFQAKETRTRRVHSEDLTVHRHFYPRSLNRVISGFSSHRDYASKWLSPSLTKSSWSFDDGTLFRSLNECDVVLARTSRRTVSSHSFSFPPLDRLGFVASFSKSVKNLLAKL